MLQSGEVLMDRYEIIKIIGKGGMSTVYQARDLQSQQLLAIKDVRRAGKENNQVVELSLAAEGRMLMQLSNSHLPKIYDIIEENDRIMLVMDFIQGESLDKVLARNGAQSVEQVLNWGMQICEVFHYLHNQPTPVIYRDMKPANIMMKPDGQLMLIDFGTARTQKVGVYMQADTICIGTEGFAAPEQFGGIGQSTAQTDIFCLGATLYNMVTGHSPCDRPTGILPLEQWNPELKNMPISEIITKCTRNDPNERYQTAMELHDDLYEASIGTYKVAGKRGFPSFSSGWQKQDIKTSAIAGAGLSGLLQGLSGQIKTGGSEQPKTTHIKEKTEGTQEKDDGWQVAKLRVAVEQTPVVRTEIYEQDDGNHWNQLTQIAIIIAAIFVVLSVVLLVVRKQGAAVAFLVIALIAIMVSVVGLILARKNQNGE